MESAAKTSVNETASFWTEEKHVHFLNNMEASFVRTMLHNNNTATSTPHHRHSLPLPLDRHLPDTFDSTLHLKNDYYRRNHRRTTKYHAPSDRRAARRRSSQPSNSSSQDQMVPQIEIGREGAADIGNGHDDKVAEN